MAIANIASRLSSLAGAGPRSEAPPAAATAADAPCGMAPSPSQKLRDVLGQFDLQQITPHEFTDLLQKLRTSGAVSDGELKDLQQVRLELDSQQTDPNQPVNLVQFLSQRLDQAQQQLKTLGGSNPDDPAQAEAAANVQSLQRQFTAVQRLTAVQVGAAAGSVDTLA